MYTEIMRQYIFSRTIFSLRIKSLQYKQAMKVYFEESEKKDKKKTNSEVVKKCTSSSYYYIKVTPDVKVISKVPIWWGQMWQMWTLDHCKYFLCEKWGLYASLRQHCIFNVCVYYMCIKIDQWKARLLRGCGLGVWAWRKPNTKRTCAILSVL